MADPASCTGLGRAIRNDAVGSPHEDLPLQAILLPDSTNFSYERSVTMKTKTRAGRYGRLKNPLVRDGGRLRPASWDEALDRAAEGLRATVERYGPRSVGMFSCSKTTNEMNFIAQKFARVVLGSNNIDSCNRT